MFSTVKSPESTIFSKQPIGTSRWSPDTIRYHDDDDYDDYDDDDDDDDDDDHDDDDDDDDDDDEFRTSKFLCT